jgi:hypothetical protein
MTIILAGGTGLIGRALVPVLGARGHDILVLTRWAKKRVPGATTALWDGTSVDERLLAGAHAVVNLAGESVGRRWTARRKREILRSRVESTTALVAAIGRLAPERRPRVLVNASGINYCGETGDAEVAELVAPGKTFLASVCVEWEAAALGAEALGPRVVMVRIPFVFARQAPALRLLAMPFRLFAGGRLGTGRQWFPWIHVDDLVRLLAKALDDDDLRGAVNAVAPQQVQQADLARELGRVLHRPAMVPTPAWALRLVLGEQADLLLHGARAIPRKALDTDFSFRYPELGTALAEALR